MACCRRGNSDVERTELDLHVQDVRETSDHYARFAHADVACKASNPRVGRANGAAAEKSRLLYITYVSKLPT